MAANCTCTHLSRWYPPQGCSPPAGFTVDTELRTVYTGLPVETVESEVDGSGCDGDGREGLRRTDHCNSHSDPCVMLGEQRCSDGAGAETVTGEAASGDCEAESQSGQKPFPASNSVDFPQCVSSFSADYTAASYSASSSSSSSSSSTSSSSATTSSISIYEDPVGYVGLVNQGSTCYLNSLIQMVYHLSYFRSAVYRMYQGESGASVPKALQMLFFEMSRRSVPCSTRSLTDAFGWRSEEVTTQHDLQELWILLREKLEEKMKGTNAEGAIKHLFMGESETVIETLDKSYSSVRSESFYEIPLEVKDKKDIYASFEAMVRPERLDGVNKYRVEREGCEPEYKDAERFVRIRYFPPVLMLPLKRYEIDYFSETLDQTKICDRFAHYDSLDLSHLEVGKQHRQDSSKDDGELEGESKEANSPTSRSSHLQREHSLCTEGEDPAVYRLFTVIIHSGGPRAGHYYAYIRPRPEGQWIEFNDETVRPVNPVRVFDDAYGGKVWVNSWGVQQVSTATSYILVYIRESLLDKVLYDASEDEENIPLEIRQSYELMIKKEEEEERLRKERRQSVMLRVVVDKMIARHVEERAFDLFDFLATSDGPVVITIPKKTPLGELQQRLHAKFGIPPQHQRLWNWHHLQLTPPASYRPHQPITIPNTDPSLSLDQIWMELDVDRQVELDVYLEEAKVQIPTSFYFGNQGINVAPYGRARQTSDMRSEANSHEATRALEQSFEPDRDPKIYSQTSPEDVSPCWMLELPGTHRIRRVVVRNRQNKKYSYRFQNINLVVGYRDRSTGKCQTQYDYKEHYGCLFNERNELGKPTVLEVDFASEGMTVVGNVISITKDNSHFPPPPPTDLSDMRDYQNDFDMDEWGYAVPANRAAWQRNHVLALSLVEVWADPPPKPVLPPHPTLLPYTAHDMLVAFKYFDPTAKKKPYLRYLGTRVVHHQEKVVSLVQLCLQLAGLPAGTKLLFYDENLPSGIHELDYGSTLKEELDDGNIITFQIHPDSLCDDSLHFRTAAQYYQLLNEERKVDFYAYDDPTKLVVTLDLLDSNTYPEITAKLGSVLRIDPQYIRLWGQEYFEPHGPRSRPELKCAKQPLRRMLIDSGMPTCGMFFEVLDIPLDAREEMIDIELARCTETGEVLSTHSLTLPPGCTVELLVQQVLAPESTDADLGNDHTAECSADANSTSANSPVSSSSSSFATTPPSMVLLEISRHCIEACYSLKRDCPRPRPSCTYELRPVPHGDERGELVNLCFFDECTDKWTGRPHWEYHSKPLQAVLAPFDTWGSFLQRVLSLLDISLDVLTEPPYLFVFIGTMEAPYAIHELSYNAIDELTRILPPLNPRPSLALKRPKPRVRPSQVRRRVSPEKQLWIESPSTAVKQAEPSPGEGPTEAL